MLRNIALYISGGYYPPLHSQDKMMCEHMRSRNATQVVPDNIIATCVTGEKNHRYRRFPAPVVISFLILRRFFPLWGAQAVY